MRLPEHKVSIIVPTYKRHADFLGRAIRSLENQTYQNIEIVIVNDNPPDSPYREEIENFIRNYDKKAPILNVANPKNMGGALARNNGIAHATGDYITFLDDDDEYLPEKIERQLAFMLAGDYEMSFTDLKLIGGRMVDYREFGFIKRFDTDSLLKYHLMRHLTGTPTFMYKADKLRQIGGFEDVKMGQEFYLMLKTIESGLKIGYLPECHVTAHRDAGGGISHGKNKITGELDLYKFKKRYFDRFTAKERRFIRFRHYAVMAVAHLRNKHYLRTVGYGMLTVLTSPADFFRESGKFIKKNKQDKKHRA